MRTRCCRSISRSSCSILLLLGLLLLLLLIGPSRGDEGRQGQKRQLRRETRNLDGSWRSAWNHWWGQLLHYTTGGRNHEGKHLPDSGAQRNCTDWEDRDDYYNNMRHYHPDMMEPCHANDDDVDDDDNQDEEEEQDDEDEDDAQGVLSVPRSPPIFDTPSPTEPPSPGPPTPWHMAPPPAPAPAPTRPPTESIVAIPVSDDPADDDDDGQQQKDKVDDDFVYATVYVSLNPNQTSIEPIVTETVTRLLNETFDDRITLYFPPRQRRRPLRQQQQQHQPQQRHGEQHAAAARQERFPRGRRRRGPRRHLQQQQAPINNASSSPPSLFYFNLVHYDTESDLVARHSQEHDGCDCWYWKYRLAYECFWKHNASRVTHTTVLQNISAYMNATLESITTSLYLQQELQEATGNDDIVVYLDEEDIYNTTSKKNNTTEEGDDKTFHDDNIVNDTSSDGSSPTYSQPLDSNAWDWRRYFGLALFLTTFCVSLIYIDWQCWRDRQSSKRQVWGNLASEEGVNELLKTGWKVQGGTTNSSSKTNNRVVTMEIYDKSKWGYESDDSMLMGGYQQHEPPTIFRDARTHAESETQHTTTQPPSSPHASPRTPVTLPLDVNSSSRGNSNSSPEQAAAATATRRSVQELPAPPLIPIPPPGPPSLP